MKNLKNNNLEIILRQAIICAIYVVLTLLNPFSYGQIQFRISEILLFLCFYDKKNSIGLVLGCLIANLFSPMLIYDITFGLLSSILSVICISYTKNMYVCLIYPILFNGLLVGLELYLAVDLPFLVNVGFVALGEAAVMIVGIVIFKLLEKNKVFKENILGLEEKSEQDECA